MYNAQGTEPNKYAVLSIIFRYPRKYPFDSPLEDLPLNLEFHLKWKAYLWKSGYTVFGAHTEAQILYGLEFLAERASPADTIAAIISTHGDRDLICAYDYGNPSWSDGKVTDWELKEALDPFEGKLFMIIDACYAGTMDSVFTGVDGTTRANRYLATATSDAVFTWSKFDGYFVDFLAENPGWSVEQAFEKAKQRQIEYLKDEDVPRLAPGGRRVYKSQYTPEREPKEWDGNSEEPFHL
jgi:hypothetical protein